MKTSYLEIAKILKSDPKVYNEVEKQKEVLIVRLDSTREGKLLDAHLLHPTQRSLDEIFYEVIFYDYSVDAKSTEVIIRLEDDGDPVLTFHETRPSTKTHRVNGINTKDEERFFPFVIYLNTGTERLTVDGEWLEHNDFTVIQDADINSPEVRQALDEFNRSKKVLEEIRQIKIRLAEKENEEKEKNQGQDTRLQ